MSTHEQIESLWKAVDRMIVDAWKIGGSEKTLDMLAMRQRFEKSSATIRQQAARVDDLDAAADRLGDYLVREQAVYLSHKSLRAALEAALSAQPAERQEEAIHVNATDDDGSILYVYPPIAKRGDKLYLHPAAPVGVPDGWTDATTPPDVSKGQDKYFWIAVRRNGNDKVYVFPAVYANAYQLCCSDDEPCAVSGPFWAQQPSEEGDEGDIEITGWYDIKSNSEYDSYYTPVCSKGDVVVAWHKGPEFAAAPSAPQGVECQHSWVTDGINPTCCSKCKRPAMPTHPTERK